MPFPASKIKMGTINDTLQDVGDGLGGLLTNIAAPVGTILAVVISIAAVGAILFGVAEAVVEGIRRR